MVDVSIVIVCMNNLGNLYPCLDSILRYTKVTYEVIVVAFMFSKDNLKRLQIDYPWIKIIISNELRGFSENNNIALREACGKYCFIVNDDTFFHHSVIDILVSTIENLPANVAIVSPVILNKDGSIQRNGKCEYNKFTYLLQLFKLKEWYNKRSKYVNQQGIYKTYNISGACFLIKTDIFRNVGWFDERYYFCPEDIALSTKLNKKGFQCYVNTDARIVHIQGGTWSKIQAATMPAAEKGNFIFYTDGSTWFKYIYILLSKFTHSLSGILWYIKYCMYKDKKSKIKYKAHFNTVQTIANHETPKELFVRLYSQLR